MSYRSNIISAASVIAWGSFNGFMDWKESKLQMYWYLRLNQDRKEKYSRIWFKNATNIVFSYCVLNSLIVVLVCEKNWLRLN